MFWTENSNPQPGSNSGFRGKFTLDSERTVNIRISGASWYGLFLDGVHLLDGPNRFHPDQPEYQEISRTLPAGDHVFSVHATYWGLEFHRVHLDMKPFIYFELDDYQGQNIPVQWKGMDLQAYKPQPYQVTPLVGWMEFCHINELPAGWKTRLFEDSSWSDVVKVAGLEGEFTPSGTAVIEDEPIVPELISSGTVAERYEHIHDDPSFRFFTRFIDSTEPEPQGIYRRYDLGHVWLGKPVVKVSVTQTCRLEIAYGEFLVEGRVSPYILGGKSYNMDCYILNPGVHEISPLETRGGRFMEIHLMDPEGSIDKCLFMKRCYHSEAQGNFLSSDKRLNDIWTAGMYTHLSCSEDALVDNPTRERGQWTGDAANVGMEVAFAAFSDTRLIRKGLVQAALSADEKGLIAAMSCGFPSYIVSFAIQWIRACYRYYQQSGDRSLLEDLKDSAERNYSLLMENYRKNEMEKLAWNFVDWGYVPADNLDFDLPLTLFLHDASEALTSWRAVVNDKASTEDLEKDQVYLQDKIDLAIKLNKDDPGNLGYHSLGLLLRFGKIKGELLTKSISLVKDHISESFPINPRGARHSGPELKSNKIITPYFAHFILPPLLENGEALFVYDFISKGWGWALDQGMTTLPEVFDIRWSHSHQWSAAPTWVLTRYALGLFNRFDLGENIFEFKFHPGALENASGTIPLPGTDESVSVKWEKKGKQYSFIFKSTAEISIRGFGGGGDIWLDKNAALQLQLEI